jgi:L-lactate dehydrogenase complex protein LldF
VGSGGHAPGSNEPGHIGGILAPLMTGIEAEEKRLPALRLFPVSGLLRACPVKINIPNIPVHLRGKDWTPTLAAYPRERTSA